jgi:hypothetical protein
MAFKTIIKWKQNTSLDDKHYCKLLYYWKECHIHWDSAVVVVTKIQHKIKLAVL